MKERFYQYIEQLQDKIALALEDLDGSKFKEDIWVRSEGGGGRSRVLEAVKYLKRELVIFQQCMDHYQAVYKNILV